MTEPINKNPVEVTEEIGNLLRTKPGELTLGIFYLDRFTSKIHLRFALESMEEFQRLPEITRAEIMESMNRLYVDYTNRLKGITT